MVLFFKSVDENDEYEISYDNYMTVSFDNKYVASDVRIMNWGQTQLGKNNNLHGGVLLTTISINLSELRTASAHLYGSRLVYSF